MQDVRTVLRTFSESFAHTLVWLTYYDAVLVGSNEPIVIDEAALARRMEVPAIRDDLALVQMGTAEDLLSFSLMGTSGARAFGMGGALNTDDNVVLEFSAPESQGLGDLVGKNVAALSAARESVQPYLAPAAAEANPRAQTERWSRHLETGRRFGEAHVRFLFGDRDGPQLESVLADVRARDPGYAPLRFLLEEKELWKRSEPALVRVADFEVKTNAGARGRPAHLGGSPVRGATARPRLDRGQCPAGDLRAALHRWRVRPARRRGGALHRRFPELPRSGREPGAVSSEGRGADGGGARLGAPARGGQRRRSAPSPGRELKGRGNRDQVAGAWPRTSGRPRP